MRSYLRWLVLLLLALPLISCNGKTLVIRLEDATATPAAGSAEPTDGPAEPDKGQSSPTPPIQPPVLGTASTAGASGESGVCGGSVCGPSGGFNVAEFPTISGVDFAAFPRNPARPYQPSASGRVWYVATSGNDNASGAREAPLKSINRAIEQAKTGDVIIVGNGEYRVDSDEGSGLALHTSGITIAAEHPGAVTLTPLNADVIIGITADADNLVVDGFVIRGFRENGVYFGRLKSPQRNLVLKHLIVERSSDGIRAAIPEGTVNRTPVVQGLLLYDVWIRDIEVVGFNCGEGPCNDMRLEALRVEMHGGGMDSGQDAVAAENGENILVFNADISGASADGLDFKAPLVTVANVIVHDLARNGIKLWHGGDVINALTYNTGADAAVVFDRGARYRILNSIIALHSVGESAYAGTAGYDVPDEQGQLDIVNTIFYGNSGPMWVSPSFKLNVQNSIFFGASDGEVTWRELTVGEGFEPLSSLEDAGGGCCNLGVVDPRFVKPDSGDFRLGPGSPGRDAGTSEVEAFPSFDLLGNPRLKGSGVDLGPIESDQ